MRLFKSRLVIEDLLLFIALYYYSIMLVPLVLGRIGAIPFLISGAIAVLGFFVYMRAIARLGHVRYRTARTQVSIGMAVITVLLYCAFFLRSLPPLPLVLTDAGVYH